MNKKGFTLIEVLVSIALLAFIGVAIGISLNRSLKDNTVTNYNEFVEKVKSSAMLYVNNTPDIINSLNENSFKVIEVKDLIANGYIKENLKNPDTGDKIDQTDKIKVSYNSDNELTIDYPYKGSETEPYLYTLNYTTTYGSVEDDICYHNLNNPGLQLVKNDNDGAKDHDLVKDTTIKAYMEDGTECTSNKINASQIGTYKIRYDYTIDKSDIISSDNVKSAERTITVIPSKPVIDTFTITNSDSNDIYKAKMDLMAHDIEGLDLKYCIVATKKDVVASINECTQNSDTFQPNSWIDLDNNKLINENFNIKDTFSSLKDESEIRFFVFVKNNFEEYNYSEKQNKNEIGTNTYLLTSTLILHLNTNNSYTSSTKYFKTIDILGNYSNEIPNEIKISDLKNVPTKTTFKTAISGVYGSSFIPLTNSYYFDGWYYDADTFANKINDTDEVFGIVHAYAKWIYDVTVPTCTIKAGSPLSTTVSDNSNKYVSGWSNLNANLSVGNHTYKVSDYAGNTATCAVDVISTTTNTYQDCNTVTVKCTGYIFKDKASCWNTVFDRGDGVWAGCEYNGSMYRACQYKNQCNDKTSVSCSSGYTKINDSFCYKKL